MPSLREVQNDFLNHLIDANTVSAEAWVLADGLTPAGRMQIYRNNLYTSLSDALAAVYPVIQRLVGIEFFRQTARAYTAQHPSLSGNLHDFGQAFALYLEQRPYTHALPYLPDVARLEWAWHESYHAAEGGPLDLSTLAAVPVEAYETIRFLLAPSARLIHSPYPVLRIWQVNQDDYSGDPGVNLDQGASHLLVLRQGNQVLLQELDQGTFLWLQALAEGLPLQASLNRAAAAQPDFDFQTALHQHVHQGTLTEIRT